jgi:DNA invertase Pin-like site-specific DNA recombinase
MEYARVRGTKSGKAIGRPRAIFRRDEAQQLRAQGSSWRQIARQLGVSATTVGRTCQDLGAIPGPLPKTCRERFMTGSGSRPYAGV